LGAVYIFCASIIYANLLGTGPVGWVLGPGADRNLGPDSMVVAVFPDSPAAEAGFEAQDLVRQTDLRQFTESARPGGEYRFEVERAGKQRVLTLRLPRKDWAYFRSRQGWRLLMTIAGSMLYFLVAAVIVLARPNDLLARWGSLFLAQLAVLLAIVPLGKLQISVELAADIRKLPLPLGVTVLLGLSTCLWSPAVAVTFLGSFPRRPVKNHLLWAAVWLPGLVTLLPGLDFIWAPVYAEGLRSSPVWLTRFMIAAGAGYVTAAAALLLRNYLRRFDRNERRRMRVLVVGFGITMLAWAAFVILAEWQRGFQTRYWSQISFVLFAANLAAPICTAYAILRHRMFDIRVMLRLGLRYAAARGLLLSLVPLVGLALVVDLLVHGDQPLTRSISQRGWFYAAVGVGAYVLHKRQKMWLQALDRRFFRERYDAQRVLTGVVEEVRRSAGFEQVAPQVLPLIENAVHPEFAALTLRESSGAPRVLASGATGIPPIPTDSKLLSLIRLLGRPVEFSPGETGWSRQLPPEDSTFLRQTRIEWVFPICLAPEGTEALLVLGPKRSEEPYSKEDQDLLQAIAGSLALLLERAPAAPPLQGFEECPVCGTCFEAGSGRCASDGAKLSFKPFSRMVARRYRLERRLGQGGMGTVYHAFDTELDRSVALKLIRSEVVAGAEAESRFRREAKAAAGFSHPNVVTIHDFGVADDERPYLVMELLDGCTLREELNRHGRFSVARALRALRGVCAAVAAAHERGLLHRDLKPENIFLTSTGDDEVAKVLDFGLAKQLGFDSEARTASVATEPGVLVGTLRYMSPERLGGEAATESWDIWALGVVAYETLTGAYPFTPSDAGPRGRLAEVRIHLPDAPPEWQGFFDRALAPDRSERPASALDFFAEFQAVVAGMPETTTRGSERSSKSDPAHESTS
jgi:tRNA A-37 threonylcarbamoyl transferase component Bud32